ncbi:MAG: transglutaminase domain-containing protein [Planctomycetales bacterium]|nr:transglutaminase domain-containing protein [Planctomycetales bacterium]
MRTLMPQHVTAGLSLLFVGTFACMAAADTKPEQADVTVSEEPGQRVVREEILPDEMQPEDGFAFRARLRLDRQGDRDSDASRCRLLEDGKPLPLPQSRHAEIREQGGGRYSHWTASQLYFSASDSSDPRTNGRKYELVSSEDFVRKTAHLTATSDSTSFAIAVPEGTRVRPLRIVLQNLDTRRAVVPRLVRRGEPDITSAAAIVESITNAEMTDEQRAVAIWKFLVDWRYHDYPAEERGEVHDPVKLINVYGYGFCDDSAAAFCALANQAGMKSRSYGLSGHVVAEAYFDDAWHMFDPDHEVVYRTDDGTIASVAQLEQHPEWITRIPTDPLGVASKRMAELYTTRDDNRLYQAASSPAAVLRPVLGAADRVVFDFTDTRRIHRRGGLDRPLPQSFANGTRTQSISLPGSAGDVPKSVQIRWPYAILGGKVAIPSIHPRDNAALFISNDGEVFEPLDIVTQEAQAEASFDDWIQRQRSATYSFWLKAGHAPLSCQLDTYFQFAPRSLAQVRPGLNDFDLFLEGIDNNSSSGARRVRVELLWEELTQAEATLP